MDPRKKSTVFEAEIKLMERCREIDTQGDPQLMRETFSELTQAYAKLLRQTEKITRVGDSIQRKLVKARHEIILKNKRLTEAQRQLVHKEKMVALNTLVQGLAHEICNPLNFINNFANLNLEMCEELKERFGKKAVIDDRSDFLEQLGDLHHGASIIRDHGLRAASIVESMGRMINAGPGKAIRRPADVGYLLRSFASSVSKSFQETLAGRLRIEHELSPSLPKVHVVIEEVGTVFTQLIINACEALQECHQADDQFQPILRLVTEVKRERVYIHVEDNGPGIAPEIGEKIFTPFFTTRAGAANIGLGLSTAYDIVVHGYQGELMYSRCPQGFTRFTVGLPLHLAKQTDKRG